MQEIRPFHADTDKSTITLDENFKRAIRNSIADWDGTRWEAVEAVLLAKQMATEQTIPTLTLQQICQRFAALLLVPLPGRLETTTPQLVTFNKEERCSPMTKAEMMRRLGMTSLKKFNTFAERQGIKEAGNRQLFQLRIDTLDPNSRKKLTDN